MTFTTDTLLSWDIVNRVQPLVGSLSEDECFDSALMKGWRPETKIQSLWGIVILRLGASVELEEAVVIENTVLHFPNPAEIFSLLSLW